MLKYSIISRKNPMTEEYLYHANLATVTTIGLKELAEEVGNMCTLIVYDIKAVISTLEERVYKALRNGALILIDVS